MASHKQIILGLDLGTTSIGWSLIECDPKPRRIIDMGVRIFPEGVDRTKGEKSRNQDRREARSLRRQGYRRVRRKTKLLHALQHAGLLPRNEETLTETNKHNPYELRTRALDEKLTAHEVGRAIYHLGQRRGFRSNRKTDSDKEDGVVKQGISALDKKIQQFNCRTLGEYFNTPDPERSRIRTHYTARHMYEQEFDAIWDAQEKYHPKAMTIANRKRIREAIFSQRPLKIQKHLVGMCEFEKDRKRAAAATLAAQEFRLWQNLNHLKVKFSDGEERFLTDAERLTLADKLAFKKSMKWEQVRKVLELPDRSSEFNLERVRKSGIQGNQTVHAIAPALGKGATGQKLWKALGERRQEQLVADLLTINDDDGLRNRLRRHWCYGSEEIEKLMKVNLPKGYMHLSQKAIRNILPHMKRVASDENRGLRYDEACLKAGYHHSQTKEQNNHDTIMFPGKAARDKKNKTTNHASELSQAMIINNLRNPMVERALYQVRRVVNTVIKRYGKPDTIRIEMARDIKANRKQRSIMDKRNKENEQLNKAAETALQEYGIKNPSRSDLLKYRLWNECKRECPYTGKSISMDALFGDHPQFDIEHIIPYQRSLDDSYMNKTLCYRDENARKGNLSPAEFYSGDEKKYKAVLQRASSLPYAKAKRFSLDAAELDKKDFVSQQLNETRYIATQTTAFLSQLANTKIESVKGGTTALLRRAWGLNNILSPDGEKNRLDHRHHAIDALVVALTDRSAVKALNTGSLSNGRLRIEEQREPMLDIRHQAQEASDRIIVSHKTQRKVSGPLHEETLYGIDFDSKNEAVRDKKGNILASIRKPLASLTSPNQLDDIKDPVVRDLAKAHLATHGTMKQAFQNDKAPFGFAKNDNFIPIRKVRLQYPLNVTTIAEGKRQRHVKTGSNHHLELTETTDKKGNKKWQGHMVSTLEAAMRKKSHQPIIQTNFGEGRNFVMALHINDMVRMEHEGEQIVCYLQKMTQTASGQIQIIFRPHNDATEKADRTFQISKSPETLRKSGAKLLTIDALGQPSETGDMTTL